MYRLYYAGMAADRQTEQIGLACSTDGIHFTREGSGLIIPIDPAVRWKSLRTCNPTVIHTGSTWTMFYQGVGRNANGDIEHAIARAHSADGHAWSCEPSPFLTFDTLRAVVKDWERARGGGVIEPSVIVRDGSYEMVFVAYQDTYAKGTWLFRAHSADGEAWHVAPVPLSEPADFDGVRVHYPQLMNGGSQLWFTAISRASGAAAICSAGLGARLTATRQHLPHGEPLHLEPRQVLPIRSSRLNQWANRLLHDGRHYWGYAHSHLLATAGHERMYYHSYHRNAAGQMWMDIGSCLWNESGGAHHAVALSPSAARQSWDSFFVADPFVVSDSDTRP